MTEGVRLVIWDLDETFWKGTLTEGGISEYVQAHHDIVVTLARRGIISSICSKNDEAPVREILQAKGLWDHFVFPDINWEPKGGRVASIIETAQLRPATVMFIDDNPSNRAEVLDLNPGIQVADERFIAEMLASPLFTGKNDEALTRLAQYKLLETKRLDQRNADGDNSAFLRSCSIKVMIEYNVEAHLDRAIELINRTNQLNFTKRRLPEDIAAARDQLREEIDHHDRQAGLVRVVDKYGDYGIVGFFLAQQYRENGETRSFLLHYCFSCRTLGMEVETWLYRYLDRPSLQVSGEVLTDIGSDKVIDWIRLVSSLSADDVVAAAKLPEIRFYGGCEGAAIMHYLANAAETNMLEANFASDAFFVRVNSSAMLVSAANRDTEAFREEMASLGIPADPLITRFFAPTAQNTLLIYSGQLDSGHFHYRHRTQGWVIKIEISGYWDSLTSEPIEHIEAHMLAASVPQDTIKAALDTIGKLRVNWIDHRGPSPEELTADMRWIFDSIPVGSRLVIVAPGDIVRTNGQTQRLAWVTDYLKVLSALTAEIDFVRVVCINDILVSDDEILEGWNHYSRMVYFRLAQAILEAGRELRARQYATAAVGLMPEAVGP